MKLNAHLNREARRYLAYAAGEILLVIAGILIALQIDNWNSQRQERATLDNYLQAIARNMRDDLLALEELSAQRNETMQLASNAQMDLLSRPDFSVEQVFYMGRVLRAAATVTYFNANSSGFDALKVSGVLDELQGMEIEPLLSHYYLGVRRMGQLEEAHNTRIMSLGYGGEVTRSEPIEIFAIENPTALRPGRFAELQDFYRENFNAPLSRSLLDNAIGAGAILREYHQLKELARLFIEVIDDGHDGTDLDIGGILAEQQAIARGAGPPELVRDGRLDRGFAQVGFGYTYFTDDQFASRWRYLEHDNASEEGGSLRLSYKGGAEWAVYFLEAQRLGGSSGRPSLDFSRFDRVRLELKGGSGGERLLLHMKDKDDPDDGSQTNLELVLSDRWQNYEFSLADFANADPSMLSIVLGFLMLEQEEPLTFEIRSIRFLKPGE